MMSTSDFAAKIKAKYPQYANMDDAELSAKVVAKHPEYQNQVSLSAPAAAPQESDSGGLEGVARAILPRSFKANDEGAGIGRTMLAGAGDALSGVLRVPAALGRMADTKMGLAGDHSQGFTESLNQINQGQDATGTKNMVVGMESDPATLPTMAVPLGKAAKGAGLLGKVISGAQNGIRLGATSAAIHQGDRVAQGQSIDPKAAIDEVGANAVVGGALPVIGAGLQATGKGILNTVIKPGKIGTKRGFQIGSVFDQGVDKGAYTLEGMGDNAAKTVTDQSQIVKDAIQSKMADPALAPANKEINATGLLGDVEQEFEAQIKKGKGSGDYAGIKSAIEHYTEAINKMANPETGTIPLDVANNFKSDLQEDAKRYYQAANLSGATEPSAKEKVASALARKIRAQILDKVPEVAQPNEIMSKVIPVRDAIENRTIIANQNQGLGLGRMAAWGEGIRGALSGHPGELAIPLGYEIQRSPLAAAKMYRLGQGLQQPGAQRLGVLKNPLFATGEDQ